MVSLLCVYWAWLRNSDKDITAQATPVFGIPIEYPWAFFLFGVVLHFSAWIAQSIWLRQFKYKEGLLALGVGFAGGVLLWLAATKIFDQPVLGDAAISRTEYFVCFALPLLLVFLLLAVTLFVGFNVYLTDEDREWLARFGAWVLIGVLGWSAISCLVIFGPHLLIKGGRTLQAAVAAAGGISGFLVVLLGRSASTAANEKQQAEGKQSSLKDLALKLAAPVFVLVFLVALSLATSELIFLLKSLLDTSPFPNSVFEGRGHLEVIHYSSIQIVILVFAAFLAIGLGMSLVININNFSLHSMYRNRLIRAYLGASNEKRRPNPFTGFDPGDDIQMHKLRPELFHVGSFFTDPAGFFDKLTKSSDPVSQYLLSKIKEELKNLEAPEHSDSAPSLDQRIRALNEVIEKRNRSTTKCAKRT